MQLMQYVLRATPHRSGPGNLPDARKRVQFDLLAHDAEINAALSPFLRDIFTWINELGKIQMFQQSLFYIFVSVAVLASHKIERILSELKIIFLHT